MGLGDASQPQPQPSFEMGLNANLGKLLAQPGTGFCKRPETLWTGGAVSCQ